MKSGLPDDELLARDSAEDLDAKLLAALERAGQALRAQLGDAARRSGLSPTQAQVLLRLASDPAPRRRIGALASELDVTHPTISDAVAALERKGLVEREGPGRRAPLAPTAAGRSLADDLAAWPEPIRALLAELPAADREATLRLLLSLIAAMQRSDMISVARTCATCRFFRPAAHPGSPHHCALVDLPLADHQLRVDCTEHKQPRASSASP